MYISNRELDELGESLARYYLEKSGSEADAKSMDIAGLAKFLGLRVVFAPFAEKDLEKIGFLADGKTPLMIKNNGEVAPFLFPVGTIVLDILLHQKRECGRCRFTIAHEIAHYVMELHRPAAEFYRVYDENKEYTPEEMRECLNMTETQADRLAAALLMPKVLVQKALEKHHDGRKIIVYGQNVFSNGDQKAVSRMAEELGVSFTALVIRLRQFDMLEYRPIEEYLDKTIPGGAA